MGQQLIKFYEKAKEIGGMQAQVKLAMITKISSVKAKELPDDVDNVKTFNSAIKKLEEELDRLKVDLS